MILLYNQFRLMFLVIRYVLWAFSFAKMRLGPKKKKRTHVLYNF